MGERQTTDLVVNALVMALARRDPDSLNLVNTRRWSLEPARRLHGDWSQLTRSQLHTILFDYIETFYNRTRHQAGLEHRTPAKTYAASRAA